MVYLGAADILAGEEGRETASKGYTGRPAATPGKWSRIPSKRLNVEIIELRKPKVLPH